MGICWASPSNNPSPVSTRQFSSKVGMSQTTNNTTSSDETNISGNSQFSAASGSDEIYPNGQILPTPNLRIFSFAELKNATRNFRTDTVLGEGGFGKVYKGWLDEKVTSKNGSGSVVAVKKLNSESMQGFQEWQVIQLTLISESKTNNGNRSKFCEGVYHTRESINRKHGKREIFGGLQVF